MHGSSVVSALASTATGTKIDPRLRQWNFLYLNTLSFVSLMQSCRDENFRLFRGFPLFSLKFAEIKIVRFAPVCRNLMSFERGYGDFLFFFCMDLLFFIEILFSFLVMTWKQCDILQIGTPVPEKSHPLQVKEPKGNLKWLLLGLHPATRSVQCTPASVIYLQFYTYASQDSLGLHKVSPTRKSLCPLQNFPL